MQLRLFPLYFSDMKVLMDEDLLTETLWFLLSLLSLTSAWFILHISCPFMDRISFHLSNV